MKKVLLAGESWMSYTTHVKGFDSYIILLEGENRQQNMIYKHAVSTIVPGKYINLQNQQQNNR